MLREKDEIIAQLEEKVIESESKLQELSEDLKVTFDFLLKCSNEE